MKKCLIKGMTVIMISTMLASTPVVSYAAETEPKNLTESAVPESDVQNAVNTVDIPETDKESETGGQLPQEQPSQEQPPQEQPPQEQPPQEQPPQEQPPQEQPPQEQPPAEIRQGWVTSESGTQYYIDNVYVVGEKKIDGYWYYFDANGMMATGWTVQEVKPDKQYYYGADGKMQYGWLTLENKTYYFHPSSGVMMKECERKIDGKYYYFNADGTMATGWTKQAARPDKIYYYNPDGTMSYGEKKIDGHWYYFHERSGVMQTGWVNHHNHTYYYNPDGTMYYGEKKENGHWYYFKDRTGVMATGLTKHHNHTYYYNADGTMYYGEKKISGHWYYFKDRTGVMATGWTKHHGKQYYYAADGKMCYGLQTIDGVRYYFHPTSGVYQWKNRKYQNPSQYYQIQESSIQLSGGGYNLNIGYEGIKTAWVIRALKLGNAVGMGGAEYTRRVFNAVKSFQSRHGLEATGITDLATWKALGYSEADWYSLGAYASPIRTSIYSSRSDCVEAMINRAYDYLGDDYMIGASGAPGLGIDCSGLVMQALYAAGIDMSPINPVRHASPGYEYESANIWTSSQLKHVSYGERQRGDIIIYCNSAGVVIHSAIYLGNNRVIEAWPNKVVVSSMINNQHPRVLGIVRPFV